MNLNIPCGYVFSEQPFTFLKECGFNLTTEDLPKQGCRRAFISLQDTNSKPTGLVFYEILDERLFHFENSKPHFSSENILYPGKPHHENSAFSLIDIVDSSHPLSEPWMPYLTIRKYPGLLAVILACDNFAKARSLADFHKEFTFQGKNYGVIHLGPNCFDIILTESK